MKHYLFVVFTVLMATLVVTSCHRHRKNRFETDFESELSSIAPDEELTLDDEETSEISDFSDFSDLSDEDSENTKAEDAAIPLVCKSTRVGGDAGSCFEVVDGTYYLKDNTMTKVIYVKVKRTGVSLPLRSGERLGKAYEDTDGDVMALDWNMIVYDDNGRKLTTFGNYESDVMIRFAKSSSGTIKEVSFVPSLSDDELVKQLKSGKFTIECKSKHFVDGHFQYED